jgi:hypothetical protein
LTRRKSFIPEAERNLLRKRLGPGNTPTPHRCELSPGWHGAKSGSKDSTLGDQSIASRECKALGIGTGTVQRVLMEQPRPFDVDVIVASFASQ